MTSDATTFTDADAAALYDELNPWDGSRWAADAFYDRLVLQARSVLDVGCGTGAMLAQARASGHGGRLVGLDPDAAALARARTRCPDAEWVPGVAADAAWTGEFELATMASHAFQCLITDDELRASLTVVRRALLPGGRFAFETRHPRAQAWRDWTPEHATQVRHRNGRLLQVTQAVESVVAGVVTFTETTSTVTGDVLRVVRQRLRFLDEPVLDAVLAGCGFEVEHRYGDWDGAPVTPTSRELITVARA